MLGRQIPNCVAILFGKFVQFLAGLLETCRAEGFDVLFHDIVRSPDGILLNPVLRHFRCKTLECRKCSPRIIHPSSQS